MLLLEFTGRWLCPYLLDDFRLLNQIYYIENLGVDSGRRPFYLIRVFGSDWTHSLLFIAAALSAIALNHPKTRVPGLAVFLLCHLVVLEIQPVVKHVGDVFLNGLLICLLFGFGRKYLYVGVLCGLFWLSLAVNKFMGLGWGSGHSGAIASILSDETVTNGWLWSLGRSILPRVLDWLSVLTPWLKLSFALSCIYGICGTKRPAKWIICVIVPGIFLLTLQCSFTVGLFPAKVAIASLAFPMLKPLRFEPRGMLQMIPVLFFGMILSWSAPYKLNLHGSGLSMKAFSTRNDIEEHPGLNDVEAVQSLRESPWICRRFVRHYTKSRHLLAPAEEQKYQRILEIIHDHGGAHPD